MHNWFDILKDEFDHPATVLWRSVELRHIEEFLKKHELSSPILDLGCAEGKIAGALFKDKKLIGLDNNWELISANKKTNIYKALILADGCRMPFKSNTFGSVFSNCVIEHIQNCNAVLNEVSRVLQHKGLFLFTVPSHKFTDLLFFSIIFDNLKLKPFSGWYKNKRNKMLNHFHCYDHNQWFDILNKNCLRPIHHEYYMPQKTTFMWDLSAALLFIFNRLKIFKNIERKISFFLKRQLQKYYWLKASEGSGLLIIASKA